MSGKARPRTDQAEHARLQKTLRESVILRELGDILNSSLDLKHILQELVKRTTELCEVPRCSFWLLEETGAYLRPTTYYLSSATLSPQKRKAADAIWYRGHLSMNNPLIQRLLEAGGVLPVEDLRAEPTLKIFAEKFQVHAVMLIALMRDGRPVGLMSLDDPGQPHPFSQDQQQLARAIGQQATIAIHNARLYQQAQEQQQRAEHLIKRAQAIYEVAMRVNSGDELQVVLKLATDHLARALNAREGIALLLAPGEMDRLQPVGSVDQETQEHFEAIGLTLHHLPSFQCAIQDGKTLLLTGEMAQDREIEWMHRFGVKNVLLIPLMGSSPYQETNGDVSSTARIGSYPPPENPREKYCPGLLALNFTRRRKPTAGEYAFAQDIAAQCALALEKARLLMEAREAAALATERAGTLDAVLQAMNEGITVVTSDGQVSFSNHAVARFLGVPLHSRVPLKTFLQEHPVYTLDGHQMLFEDFPVVRALQGKAQARSARFIIARSDSMPRVVELTTTPLRNSEMQQIGLVCAIRDVTIQVQAEQRVRLALETFLHIAEVISHSSGIHAILHSVLAETLKTLNCTRGTIHLFQQNFEPLLSLGFTPDEEIRWLQQQDLWLQPETGQEYGFSEQLMNGQATLVSGEHCPVQPNPFANTLVLAAPIKHNNDTLGLILLDRSPAPNHALAPQRLDGFTNWDLTIIAGIAQLAGAALEQTHWREEASEARASEAVMREADTMKNEFLAITAHEFRNPLTVILARSQSAQRHLKRAQEMNILPIIGENLDIITAQAKQLNNIVTTFLDAARINQGQINLKMEQLDLEQIALQVIEEQAVLTEQHSLSCLVDTSQRPYLVQGDRARLHQVLANLVENAIKYSPQGGPIVIRLQRWQGLDMIEVSVEDRGLGIPPEAHERLFERFYRVPQPANTEPRGVGLGLYIVSHLITMHDSTIRVESKGISGEGSRFIFTLPALVE